MLWLLPEGTGTSFAFLGLELTPVRVDALSRVFATGFLVAAFLTTIYALHLKDSLQQTVILVYAGAAVGGALAGDLLTLFVFWEMAGAVVGVPDLGPADRTQLPRRHALHRRAADLRAADAGRHRTMGPGRRRAGVQLPRRWTAPAAC